MFCGLAGIRLKSKHLQMNFRNWDREVTAVCLSIEVFLREKPLVAVIHSYEIGSPLTLECFITFTSGKSGPCHY